VCHVPNKVAAKEIVSDRRQGPPASSGGRIAKSAATGRRDTNLPSSRCNQAKTRSKGWWKPLARGPQGGRFPEEYANLEPGSLPAVMVHWLLQKKVRGAQYSARELVNRFKLSTGLACQFLRRSVEGGWGWVEWCEDIVETGSTRPGTQHFHHDGLVRFPQVELETTDNARRAC
jgi:hypothetical protein